MIDLFTRCHKSDPQTSYDAAEKMVKSGALNRQERKVHKAIIMYLEIKPRTHETLEGLDFTTKEIATSMSEFRRYADYYKGYDICRKRFSGLHNKGKIERTGEKRDGCCVWRLKGE